jgi:hypothetical protein
VRNIKRAGVVAVYGQFIRVCIVSGSFLQRRGGARHVVVSIPVGECIVADERVAVLRVHYLRHETKYLLSTSGVFARAGVCGGEIRFPRRSEGMPLVNIGTVAL